jgi:hypothetical protein
VSCDPLATKAAGWSSATSLTLRATWLVSPGRSDPLGRLSAPAGRVSDRAPHRLPEFIKLWVGQCVSLVGSEVSQLAIWRCRRVGEVETVGQSVRSSSTERPRDHL